MADAVGNIAGMGVVAVSRAAEAAPAKATAASSASFDSDLKNAVDVGVVTPALSQHVKVDPKFGLVTQYLDVSGNVVSQVPSSFALTYLRAGLVTGSALSQETGGEVLA